MKNFNIHGGHDAQGKGASGACANIKGVGWFYESIEDRNVKNDAIQLLREEGCTVYDCTEDNGGTQGRNLSNIVAKCNSHKVDRDISIHFNKGRDDLIGNGVIGGVEVWLYDNSDKQLVADAERICANIAKLGFKNRGVKFNKNFYVLRKTASKAMIIECCFVDDKDDVLLYKKVGSKAIAKAIVEGLLNKTININKNNNNVDKTVYKIVTGGFGSKENAQQKAEYLKGLTGWYLEVKPITQNDFCIHTGGFTGVDKVERKMRALQELTGWWMTYEVEKGE